MILCFWFVMWKSCRFKMNMNQHLEDVFQEEEEEEKKKKYHLMFKPTSLNVMMMGAICLLMYLVYQTI